MSVSANKRQDILSVINRRGQNPVQGNIYMMMPIWKSWYRGNVNDFHSFKRKNLEGQSIECELLTLNMAKKVCEDWTTLLFNEKVEMTVDNEAINNEVQKVLEDNNFIVEFGNLLEKSFALGTGAMIEFLMDGKITIDYITGELVIITAYRNNDITGICTINEIQREEDIITHLTYHTLEDEIYTIEHEVYLSEDASQLGKTAPITLVFTPEEANALATEVTLYDENGEVQATTIKYMIEYETDTAHFQIIKPNIVNNYDMENPMGISVFANRIDNLKGVDVNYDSFVKEYQLAKHRIIVDSNTVGKEVQKVSEGSIQHLKVFDINDQVFHGANLKDNEKKIEYYTVPIRATEHVDGINFNLQSLGFGVGMGTDYYAFDARGVYQNEKAVISENSDLWASKKKHEQILVKAWRDLIKSILFLLRETKVITGDIKELDINILPDDSIIIDDEALYQKDLDLVDRQMMPEWKILVKWFSMSEEEAKAQIAESKAGGEVEEIFEADNPVPSPSGEQTWEEYLNANMDELIAAGYEAGQATEILESKWEETKGDTPTGRR